MSREESAARDAVVAAAERWRDRGASGSFASDDATLDLCGAVDKLRAICAPKPEWIAVGATAINQRTGVNLRVSIPCAGNRYEDAAEAERIARALNSEQEGA